MKRETLEQILADRAAKRTVVLATGLSSGRQTLLYPWEASSTSGLDPLLLEAARRAAERDECTTTEAGGETVFLKVFNPPLRMILVGAVHIAQPLSRMAAMAGFDVVLVDPRGAFATEARFPGVTLSSEWPDRAVAASAPDGRTAIITLSHDPKLDDPALAVGLRSPAFYLGALGSRRTHAGRLERLRQAGFSDAELSRIHGPVGLPIGARSPAEIAVAILAQVVESLRRGPA